MQSLLAWQQPCSPQEPGGYREQMRQGLQIRQEVYRSLRPCSKVKRRRSPRCRGSQRLHSSLKRPAKVRHFL